jgi:hypothetical protein
MSEYEVCWMFLYSYSDVAYTSQNACTRPPALAPSRSIIRVPESLSPCGNSPALTQIGDSRD